MALLRVVDRRFGDDRRITVSWEGDSTAQQDVEVTLRMSVDDAESQRVRWYLEDYAEFPADPAPAMAADAEATLAGVGRELFSTVLDGAARDAWTLASAAGPDLRVEVDADPGDVPGLPWELLRNPRTNDAVALQAAEFVRTHRQASRAPRMPVPSGDRLRVLLVICRPGGRDDVPFRSVASRLVRGGADRMDRLELTVLRPPTFARLAAVLRDAARAGQPYHVVHFDGHGAFLDVGDLAEDEGANVSALAFGMSTAGPVRPGRHGYLIFEDPKAPTNQQLVDGPTLAALLVETEVPVVVLNACRSAYGEDSAAEDPAAEDPADRGPAADRAKGDVHERVRAYGSLAAEVADAGVPGVVAMRYNVYVVTAAQFVADLYAHLVAGESLGFAASRARKALAADPMRAVGAVPVALQDWVVPTVYEAKPLRLLAPRDEGVPLIRIQPPEVSRAASSAGPDAGFFGRDETLLALDRAFDTRNVVLLHAFAGAGKTTTAREFGNWYRDTRGATRVLWTSFEHYTPLERVLDVVGTAFSDARQANGIQWSAVTDPAARRDLALQVLAQVPVVWVWDNVEPVAGFPAGTDSAWTAAEQDDLAAFLADVSRTRAKVLLTSRREEGSWLGGLAHRVWLPPMPMRERLQLAHALAPEVGTGVDWTPLLRFTGGNPLTITVAVRQAAREQATSTAAVAGFVERVRAGVSVLEAGTDAALGRDRSLAASLDYGFTRAFTDPERRMLAVLHLFRDTVHVVALVGMGDPRVAGQDAVPGLAGLTRERGVGLLDRAVEVGLLTGYGSGYYGIHPALPWYFTSLYRDHVGALDSPATSSCEQAYATAYAALGRHYFGRVEDGQAGQVLPVLRAEEGNLLHALTLARTQHHPDTALNCLQGIKQLYGLTGRATEWARLVEQVQGDYLDPATDQPLPGREDDYSIVIGYRVVIARDRRDWPTATRLQTAATTWDRDRAAAYRHTPIGDLDATGRNRLRALAVSEQDLGRLLQEQEDPDCLTHYQAAYQLTEQIGDTSGQASQASNLGNACLFVPRLRDLDQAQHWHQRSLDLEPEDNRIGRAASHGSLATVAYQRFLAARAAGATQATLLTHWNTALTGHRQALDLLPPDHHDYRATAHNQLGVLYRQAGDVAQAMRHYQQSIQHEETRGNPYGAAQTRYNIALLLGGAGRTGDALHYARAALTTYRDVGPGAANDVQETENFVQALEGALKLSR